ncbi:glutathione transport system permease protein GsiC [Clostridium tepidiprofundi DSM 19306]|uniref:Glutathione transport system permease protein GsiC n=1 Tax=Clostridium tepidiprofundi DSM 19306 TaxID=1121338 RepID=A0A151B2S9_9CLOT|nr:ABC transporter permease [Clostridium tepidiprofundi]KYH34218.1 glutathione transport system permease protein GsiC [Clostridium tepidiprofundi DSM 19306]
MVKYIFKRIIQMIPTLIVISIISFIIMNLAPGDPSRTFIAPGMNSAQMQKIKESLGLNQPLTVRYMKWIKNILNGNLGYSFITHQPISSEITARLPATLGLMMSSMIISLIFSIPLGIICAIKKNKFIDNFITLISYIGISIPSFWFAMMLMTLFCSIFRLLPCIGMRSFHVHSTWDLIKHSIMPCMVLSFPSTAVMTRYVRSSAISQLKEDYILTAKSKGMSEINMLFKHVLKNSILPLITIIGMSLPDIVTGAFITETIFGWPGMGRFGITSIFNRDYPSVMAITMISSILLILGNLISDILYGIVDPRIRVVES